MRWFATATVTAMLLGTLTLSAGEGPAKKGLAGEWVRNKDDSTVTFKFTADTLYFTSDSALGKLELEADYGVSKDGKNLFGRIRTVKEGGGPAKGDLFTFAYRVKGDTLTITDLKGTGAIALAQALQGEYKKAGGKKG
jgi:hypothetical protein